MCAERFGKKLNTSEQTISPSDTEENIDVTMVVVDSKWTYTNYDNLMSNLLYNMSSFQSISLHHQD